MDKKNLRFFGIFIGIVLVLSLYFVLADSYNQAPSSAAGGTTNSMIIFNVSNSSDVGGTTLNSVTVNITGNASYGNVTNITLFDGTTTYYNDTFSQSDVVIDVSAAISTELNFTVSFILNSTAQYGLTLGANVTAISNESNVSYSALPYNSSLLTIADATAPTATATCNPAQISAGANFPCTCSGTDSSYGSGVSTETGSSTSNSITSTGVPGTFTYTCTVTDVAGNSGTDTAEYRVIGGGAPVDVILPPSKHLQVFPKVTITPGVATIIKDIDSEIGLKEIKIEVNSEAQNVIISVAKYDGKPSLVSVEKTGKVYQYLEIVAEDLGSKMSKAVVTSKVEKSWVSDNSLNKEKIALFKFNSVNKEWEELETGFSSEDNNYYYYDTELTSFSYFVIGESLLEEIPDEPTIAEQAKNLLWLWILIILVLAIFVGFVLRKRKRK